MSSMLPITGAAGALDLPIDQPKKTSKPDKARTTAEDFEAMFLNSMFNNMFTGIDGEGPFGGSGDVGVWRSFLTDEYAKSFAKKGGIGLADHVYRTLLAQQEARGQ